MIIVSINGKYLLNALRNFSENFWGDVTYDIVKSHK